VTESVLEAVPVGLRGSLVAAAHRRRFRAGEVVFHQGDPSDVLFVLRRGHAAVRVTTPGGDEVTLAVLGPGEEFGELALLRPAHRHTATVVALDEVEALTLDRATFERLRHSQPEVAELLIDVLARRVERLSGMVAEALFLAADRRIARRLLDVAHVYGDCPQAPLPLTQTDVAAMAGVSRPTANRALRRFADRGLLRLGRRRIVITDVAGLTRAAGWP